MKRIIFFFVLANITLGLFAQPEFFYTNSGEREYFSIRKDRIIIKAQSETEARALASESFFLWAHVVNFNMVVASIDSIKVMPKNVSVSDPVLFAAYAEPFTLSGDCTYQLNVDSIVATKIYISGKFDGNNKCWDKGINDTINIGLLPAGTYELIYKLIDINPHYPVEIREIHSIEFVVSLSSKVQDVKIKKFDLYPNPCNSHINIVFSNDNEIKHIQLFDVIGKMIYEENVNQNSLQINMSLYNQGIYFIKIVSNKSEYKHKIIKR